MHLDKQVFYILVYLCSYCLVLIVFKVYCLYLNRFDICVLRSVAIFVLLSLHCQIHTFIYFVNSVRLMASDLLKKHHE